MSKKPFVSLIFLAGGIGSRMGAPLPKQYIPLCGKPIALHSFETLSQCPEIDEIVVVCEPDCQNIFKTNNPLSFARPGARRQDSVYSGLLKTSSQAEFVFIHDSVRPFVEKQSIPKLLKAVQQTGAAALASPVSSTIKQAFNQRVEKTLDRSCLWEMQTPQALRRALFLKAFDHILAHSLEITDDIAAAEAIGHPAEIVPSSPLNFKITTPFDLAIANTWISCATN